MKPSFQVRTLSVALLCIGICACVGAHGSDAYSTTRAELHTFAAPSAEACPGEYYFELANAALVRKQYAYAIQMFGVAASWAYKPAEYNLGVLYFNGAGVPRDVARGMAWMALAAERGEREYVDAREQVHALLSPSEFSQANAIWRDLKKTYGDAVALKRAKARWLAVRNATTGSHLGAVGNLIVGAYDAPREKRSDSIAQSPFGLTGGHHIDGAAAYAALRATDDPYDPLFYALAGTVSVGALIPDGTPASEIAAPAAPAGGLDPQAHHYR